MAGRKLTPNDQFNYILINATLKLRLKEKDRIIEELKKELAKRNDDIISLAESGALLEDH